MQSRTKRTLENDTLTEYGYDAADQMTSIVHKKTDLTPISSYAYGYDDAGQRKWVKRGNGKGDVYKYDATDQLTNVLYEASNPDTSPSAWTNEARYAFDAAGNRTSVTVTNSSTNSYTANALNQYEQIGDDIYPSYDANGNLWNDGTGPWVYSYDAENRLTAAEIDGVSTVWYSYDAFNRLIERTKDGSQTTRFYYDDQWRLIAEYDGSGNLLAKYVYGPEIDEPVRMLRNSEYFYYHAAALGTVTEITDASGDLVEAYRYDVYGEPTFYDSTFNPQPSTAIGNRLLFQGRDRDADTGLYNFRYRYYSPSLGRFVQVDPIGHYGGLNFFLFAANSPQVLFDPYGLAASPNDCEAACAAARKDPRINNGTSLGVVMCTGSGVKCPCLLGYKQYGFDIGDCPEIDKVILAHEQGHINAGSSQCDPNNKNPHPARCSHSKAAHTQEECELKKKDINALREAARLSKGVCKGHANAVRASAELWYETYCK